MNYRLFAGIDVSKMKTDVVFFLAEDPDEQFHGTFSNNEEGCTEMMPSNSNVYRGTYPRVHSI